MNKKRTEAESIRRFLLRVDRKADKECWEWRGYRQPSGHGKIWFREKTDYAHRVAFFVANGYFPDEVVRHKCDNPPCCNPEHLIAGSSADNMADRRLRRRSAWQQDRTGFAAKIKAGKTKNGVNSQRSMTYEEAESIRRERDEGATPSDLAKKYKISEQKVSKIVNRRIYKEP